MVRLSLTRREGAAGTTTKRLKRRTIGTQSMPSLSRLRRGQQAKDQSCRVGTEHTPILSSYDFGLAFKSSTAVGFTGSYMSSRRALSAAITSASRPATMCPKSEARSNAAGCTRPLFCASKRTKTVHSTPKVRSQPFQKCQQTGSEGSMKEEYRTFAGLQSIL